MERQTSPSVLSRQSGLKDRAIDVLILEDNALDAELMKRQLRAAGFNFKAELAQDKKTFLLALEAFIPDIILTDYSLPEFDGLTALALARQRFPDVPVIIVSGAIGEEVAIETLKAGATDYVLKHRLSRLGLTVSRALQEAKQLTERKRAEEALRSLTEDLEKQVEERSEEILAIQSELEKAKRLSDIGTLAATVAHELRNPLAAINMAVSNIRRKANNPDLDKHLFNIEKKVAESDQIISNLLFYSKIKPPHRENVNFCNLIRECVNDAQKQFKKNISFKTRLDAIFIPCDPLQMKEVFLNILNNASDAISDSGGRIEITLEGLDDMVKVAIRDNGCGIDKFHLDKVFDPFFTTKAKGTGLGLSVCQQIVSLHKGSICIESEAEKGTTVTVSLPCEP